MSLKNRQLTSCQLFDAFLKYIKERRFLNNRTHISPYLCSCEHRLTKRIYNCKANYTDSSRGYKLVKQ